jgi:hypothetical protein
MQKTSTTNVISRKIRVDAVNHSLLETLDSVVGKYLFHEQSSEFNQRTNMIYRVCLGQHLANNSLFIAMATMIATLNIDWPLGLDGKPTPFEPKWSKIGEL